MKTMQTPFGDFHLERWPHSSDKSLQAWDAADELLLLHLYNDCQSLLADTPKVLICNDSHGALACALHTVAPESWSDSSLAHSAINRNWAINKLDGVPVCVDSLTTPAGQFDLVLVKIPKTIALLEDQLARIRPHLHANTLVIAASLVRHLPRSAFVLFERYLGSVSTSLASKKSRLVFCTPDDSLPVLESPYPDAYTDADSGLSFTNHANVFCRDRIDLGARFFLDHCQKLPEAHSIVDLACGNGILGIQVQKLQPDASIHFIDESYMAVASAQHNYALHTQRANAQAQFSVANGLECVDAASTDLIICNPPFHDRHAVADDTARDFFRLAATCLRSEGELWVVANRHLPYKEYLKRHFRQCKVVVSGSRFVLLQACGKK